MGYDGLCFIHSLCDSSNFHQPQLFSKIDPNQEHGSAQYFNDAVVCMDWGYNEYNNYLALGLANGVIAIIFLCLGEVVVRSCEGGFFKESILNEKYENRSCICLSWRKLHNHVILSFVCEYRLQLVM